MPGVLKKASYMLALAFFTLLASCHRGNEQYIPTYDDSVYISSIVEDMQNPTFTGVVDVLNFQAALADSYAIEEAFTALPPEVLQQVATVCIRRNGCATKYTIVQEYRANREVYDNLTNTTKTPAPGDNTDKATAVEEQQKPVPSSVSYEYETDTVDGKPIQVLVKKERYESK